MNLRGFSVSAFESSDLLRLSDAMARHRLPSPRELELRENQDRLEKKETELAFREAQVRERELRLQAEEGRKES